jgi:hypothetical protein
MEKILSIDPYVRTRQKSDQEIFQTLADEYFTAKEKKLLQNLSNRSLSEMKFDAGEYRLLRSRAPSMLDKSSLEAFFKFCFTIDVFLNLVREINFKVQNMNMIDSLSKDELDHDIIAPDFRLWPFHDKGQWSGGYKKGQLASGSSLGVRRYTDESDSKLKDNVKLHEDEVFLLSFRPLRILAGLAQGLFFTEGRSWCNAGINNAKNANLKTVETGYLVGLEDDIKNFINSAKQNVADAGDEGGQPPANGGPIGHFTSGGDSVKWPDKVKELNQHDSCKYSKRLSDAYIQSHVNMDLNNMYTNLQKFYLEKRALSTLGYSPHNPVDFMNFRNRQDGYASTFNCGPGMVPRFIGHNGEDVPYRHAVIERNGKQFINTALVDPDRSYCTATIPVTQAGRFQAMLSQPFPDAYRDNYGISSTAPVPFNANAMLLSERNNMGMPLPPMPVQDKSMRKMEKKKMNGEPTPMAEPSKAEMKAYYRHKHKSKKKKSKKGKSRKGHTKRRTPSRSRR